ncbi:unnamed protein product [Anisakis simplex]|uniref:Uso1_p115_head domain-containing protein n=1 Tax=Anisakis simplex TaxID=6269 RepID=A0A0M3JQU7_ANISI|nr:unnamed protein product [Anisakis simplex]
MAYFRNLFGGQTDEARSDNDAEVVEKYLERVETSTAYEDRRDALRALRSFAKTETGDEEVSKIGTDKVSPGWSNNGGNIQLMMIFILGVGAAHSRLRVGSNGMAAYIEILEKERNNPEIIAITLEILVAVVCDDDETSEGTDELGERLSEMMINKKGFISSIIALLECYDFNVRRALVQLLTALLRHRASEVQNAVMNEPMGVSRLVDILHETREVVRNNAVLMLSELSRANSQIQQLLAYENAFQLLFDIIDLEPVDSIVIEDCLFVILNLLRKNSSNQQLFREASLVQRLALMLHSFLFGREGEESDFAENDSEWPRQKIANIIFLLQVLRSLVSPRENAQTNTHAAQKIINQCGMLGELCSVLLSEMGVPVEVLTETIIAIAEVIRGSYSNQEYFAARQLLTNVGSRPSLLVLLTSMTTEKQSFKLRCAVFYCFLSYLYDNEIGKTKVWMGCVCLMHCLFDTDHLKEQLLRVQLTTDSAQPPSSLLQHISNLLVSLGNRKPQIRCALLMLLAVWLHRCPLAVKQFIQIEECIQYLTTHIDECGAEGTEDENQVTKGLMALVLALCLLYGADESGTDNKLVLFSTTIKTNSLSVIVERRVGNEKIFELLEGVSRSEHYVRAAQRPQPLSKSANEMLLDYQFTKLFKLLENQIGKQLRRPLNADGSCSLSSANVMNGSNDSNVVASFKELIKRQDETIASLNQQIKKLNADREMVNSKANESSQETVRELAQLRQKLAALECDENDRKQAEQPHLEHYKKAQIQMTKFSRKKFRSTIPLFTLTPKDLLNCVGGPVLGVVDGDIHNIATQWQNEALRYQQWAEQWQQYQIAQVGIFILLQLVAENSGEKAVIDQLSGQLKELEGQLNYGWQSFETQGAQLATISAQLVEANAKIRKLEQELEAEKAATRYSSEAAQLQIVTTDTTTATNNMMTTAAVQSNENGSSNAPVMMTSSMNKQQAIVETEELIALRREHEDLLVLLADQDAKLSQYRQRLMNLGQTVTDDEEDDEEGENNGDGVSAGV